MASDAEHRTPTSGTASELSGFLELQDVLDITKLGRTKIFEDRAAGRLETVLIGRRVLFTPAAVKAYLELLATEGQQAAKEKIAAKRATAGPASTSSRRSRPAPHAVEPRELRPLSGKRGRGDAA